MKMIALAALALTLAACNDDGLPQPSPTPVENPEPECEQPSQCNEP